MLMKPNKIYDVIGIGLGPFNLGLAALLDDIDDLEALFFERQQSYEWHPGMLIEGTDMQVSFIADLVTFANPKSPYTFLNYLHETGRLYPFFYFRKMNVPRNEYNDYAKWVGERLTQARYGHMVRDVINHAEDSLYEIIVADEMSQIETSYFAKHVVLGTGSLPNIPEAYRDLPKKDILHSSSYLYEEPELEEASKIVVVGSGQSASEIFCDLLGKQSRKNFELAWFTRSGGIFQLEEAKIGQEFFSPDYVSYFRSLSFENRQKVLPTLNKLTNGVERETLDEIYDLLYHRSISQENLPVTIQPITELENIEKSENGYALTLRQWQKDKTFTYNADKVILSTGYKPNLPDWLMKMENEIVWEDEKLFKVADDYRIVFKDDRSHYVFTLTNLGHSDGTGATHLGLSVQRNQKIINTIAGREVYPVPNQNIFQQFTHEDK